MVFILGLITGLLVSIFIFVVQIYFQNRISKFLKQSIKKIQEKEKGEIFLPPSEDYIKLEKNYEFV